MSWNSFLRDIADRYQLSGIERDIFIERFNEYNYEKTETEIIADLHRNLRLDIDETAYKKQLRIVYEKLIQSKENPEGCPDLDYKGPNKYKKLLAWLEAKYEQGSVLETPEPLPKPQYPNIAEPLNSPFYIERPAIENHLYEQVLQPGSLIRIKAANQIGKTSLLIRILDRAAANSCQTVRLNFWEDAKPNDFESLDKLLRWLCVNISRQLHFKPQLDADWDENLDSKTNCTAYLQTHFLSAINSPLILGLDEIDRIFHYLNFADDFLYLLREWYEKSQQIPIWKNLRLVLTYSTEPYIRLESEKSPFAVGLETKISEFTVKEVQTLADLHNLCWQPKEVKQLMAMVGGHPYLVRLAFYHLTRQKISLEQLLSEAISRSGIYGEHLKYLLDYLDDHPELRAGMRKVLKSEKSVQLDITRANKLEALGLVKIQGSKVIPSCQLYREYFRDRL
ncbi:AAA-like domain-containing protein [Aerosakkonemataceae cyanobacterium BLCC-F154]|uniref:AAA-like domain-containing protein n=1 Tax=Floridaenema fluviatile BLCC-F154 TaxID=3153640 RepID=A0ABV4Y5W4_9CYAN